MKKAPTRIIRIRGVEHHFYDVEAEEPKTNPIDNTSERFSEVVTRERMSDEEILQISFELGMSFDDEKFWDTLENLSRW